MRAKQRHGAPQRALSRATRQTITAAIVSSDIATVTRALDGVANVYRRHSLDDK